jgi:sugar phosphate isomerase/epimerase
LRGLPGSVVLAIQLDDGPATAEDDLIEATLHRRLLPGAGDFDLTGYLGALADTGSRAPLGVEVFSDELHILGAQAAARLAAEATRGLLAQVDGAVAS